MVADTMEESINICKKAANASTLFEITNTDLKRDYIVHNIELYNQIVALVDGSRGSFGTGYPFYTLDRNLQGQLPIIGEQIRYNYELLNQIEDSSHSVWPCLNCLEEKCSIMPDLKSICKPCPNTSDTLKPRKIINRLPDIDMWMVCKDNYIDVAKEELSSLFCKYGLQSSDINPIQTIENIAQIAKDLDNGIMTQKLLSLDAHIIGYSTLLSLIEQVPSTLKQAIEEKKAPYLPIHPLSYRKTWQYDDVAYNYIYDYLSAFTEFNFDDNLQQALNETRAIVANSYSVEQLYDFLVASAQDSNKRRFQTLTLQKSFRERVELWKK